MKAKSRLQSSAAPVPKDHSVSKPSPTTSVPPKSVSHHHPITNRSLIQDSPLVIKYVKHILTFLLSLPFYGMVLYIYNSVSPTTIKNTLLPNMYLLFQLPLFIANFFFFSFLLLNTRRGLLIAIALQLFFFTKLQALTWTPVQLLMMLMGFVIIETAFVAYNRKVHD